MNNLFLIQLILSFFVGGIAIATLSFIAERTSDKIAGVVLSLPSTVVITFIFIGWTTSAQTVSDIVPTSIAADGSVMIFTIVYLYLSKIKLPKIYSILLSFSGGVLTWLTLSIPFTFIKFDNLLIPLIIAIIDISIVYYLLTIKNNVTPYIKPIIYTTMQKIGRAVFTGSIICLAVLLSKIINPFWGGIFSGFPAAFSSTFIILHWYYGSNMLFKVGKSVAAGSLVYLSYIIAVHWTCPAFGIIGGTITAYMVSLVIFFFIMKFKNKKTPF